MKRAPILDPWSVSKIEDYGKLIEDFGIEEMTDQMVRRFPKPSRFLRRRIEFGHRDMQRILAALERNQPYAVMSGIKPSGPLHLGSKMTAEEIIYYQSLSDKARASYCVADLEAYADNRIPLKESHPIAVGNVADLLALGLDPRRAYIYKQSDELDVQRLAFVFSREVTSSTLRAVYGDKHISLYFSSLVQAGDIVLPQMKSHGGPKPVLVPVGVDQDPHIRLTRDLARRYREAQLVPPSAVFHKLTRSLKGEEKMSKRDPMGVLELTDSEDLARKKIMMAFTGGRGNVEEQRKLGGEPEKCVVYELLMFHFAEDDDELRETYAECRSGNRICGECKHLLVDRVVSFLKGHQRKRRKTLGKAAEILGEG